MKTLLLAITIAASACAASAPRSPTMAHQAFSLFNDGKSLDEIADQLNLDSPRMARAYVHDGMMAAERRYFAAHGE